MMYPPNRSKDSPSNLYEAFSSEAQVNLLIRFIGVKPFIYEVVTMWESANRSPKPFGVFLTKGLARRTILTWSNPRLLFPWLPAKTEIVGYKALAVTTFHGTPP